MALTNIFGLLGGLGLFLYGMTLMSQGLETAAGSRLKQILEKLTANRFIGVGVGALVAALTQSSSATTVMAIGFVNSGLMDLRSAVWIIMGANIGTTITGQLIALNFSAYAPLILFAGVLLAMFAAKGRSAAVGQVLIGLGMLFMGLEHMSQSMEPLRYMPEFTGLLAKFENPLLGIAVGAIFTAVIQSSSASVGILQTLALSGVVTLPSAIYVLFGQNIGTCITAILASIGSERNAKRATLIHLLFNVIGTVVFVAISLTTPFVHWMEGLTPGNVPVQIANVHTIFNVVTTFLLLPFGAQLVRLTYVFLPDLPQEPAPSVVRHLDFNIFNQEYHVGLTTMMGAQLYKEVMNMLGLVRQNVALAFSLYNASDIEDKVAELKSREQDIDELNQQIVQYAAMSLTHDANLQSGEYVKIASDLERLGDHATNIMERLLLIHDSKHDLSEEAREELTTMSRLALEILDQLKETVGDNLEEVNNQEQLIDQAYESFERMQIQRLKSKVCGTSNSVHFAKILTDFERIGDHCLNIAQEMNTIHPSWKFVEQQD